LGNKDQITFQFRKKYLEDQIINIQKKISIKPYAYEARNFSEISEKFLEKEFTLEQFDHITNAIGQFFFIRDF